jgi:hypothetical protein
MTGTPEPTLYHTGRYGAFAYAIPLAPGPYEVTLHLAETYYWAAGQRVFEVTVEDQRLPSLDLVAEVGSAVAGDVTVLVTVTDGVLDLDFQPLQSNALVQALTVEPASVPTVATPTITPNGGVFSATVTVTLEAPLPPGAGIYYTLDGSLPTTASFLYTAPFLLSHSATVHAQVWQDGYQASEFAQAVFNDANFYVAPTGTPQGDGSRTVPWDLATALAHPSALTAGATLYLRGGIYDRVNTISRLTGTPDAPITVRSYPGEWAVLDFQGGPYGGGLTLDGAWTVYRNFEVTSFESDHVSAQTGSHPTDVNRTGFTAAGENLKLLNLVIHDLVGVGLGSYAQDQDIEIYGNILYYNGFEAPDRPHGHGMYVQNATGGKRLADNIVFSQYHSGLHLFDTKALVNNIEVKGNIVFNNGAVSQNGDLVSNIIVSSLTPMKNITVEHNYTYHPKFQGKNQLGHTASSGLTARDNYFIGGLWPVMVRNWTDLTFTDNTIWGEVYQTNLVLPAGGRTAAYSWDANHYTRGRRTAQYRLDNKNRTFPAWQSVTGLDAHSTEQVTATGRPTGVTVFVRPNRYEAGRAHIVVYNWDEHDTIEVEVSQVLVPGMAYEVRDVQNYFGPPVAAGLYDGQPLTLPMTGLEVTAPHGNAPTHPAHTGPVFGAFVLLAQ